MKCNGSQNLTGEKNHYFDVIIVLKPCDLNDIYAKSELYD